MRFPGLYQALTHAGAQVRCCLAPARPAKLAVAHTSLSAVLRRQVLLVPAAFTVPTGMAHWEVLLRARAIENQVCGWHAGTWCVRIVAALSPAHTGPCVCAVCHAYQCYVIASAQIGAHNAKRTSYGHAMVIDPWGTVIAQCAQVRFPAA